MTLVKRARKRARLEAEAQAAAAGASPEEVKAAGVEAKAALKASQGAPPKKQRPPKTRRKK